MVPATQSLVPQNCMRIRPTMSNQLTLRRARDDVDPANMFQSLQASQCLDACAGGIYPIHVQCIFRRLRFLSVPVFALTGSSLSLLAGIYWLSFVRMAGIAEQMRAGKPRQHPDSIQSVLQEFTS